MTSNVLSFFWNLSSSSKDTRLSASADLVNSLETFHRSHQSNGGPSPDEDDDEDDDESDDESGIEVDGDEEENSADAARLDKALAKNNAEDVVYSVKRLVRGLASSRESSRLGFAVALTELLSRVDTVSAEQVLSLLVRASPYAPTSKGAEARDALFARLFGLTAIIQSGSLFRQPSSARIFGKIIGELISLGSVKGWLRESAWWGIVNATAGLLDSDAEWTGEGLSVLVEMVYGEKNWNQEKIALTLILEQRRPGLEWKKLLAPAFKHTPLLHSSNLVAIGRLLKESDVEDEEEGLAVSGSTGAWKPQLHFVWKIILDTYFSSTPSSTESARAPFQDFFRVVVDESLFSNASSSERKYWGFSVLTQSLPIVPSSQLPLLFTPNVMRCWINNLSSSDRYLHKAALNLAKQVQDTVKTSPTVGFTLLSTLVGKNGRTDFDKATKTKTVEGILGGLSKEGVSEYTTYLQDIILGEDKNGSDGSGLEERRIWALDQILGLFRNGKVPKQDSTVASVLEFLLVHAFFTIRKTDKKSNFAALHTVPKPPLSESTAAACRAKFFSCLVEITTASPVKDSGRQQACDESGKLWIRRTLDILSALEANKKHVESMLDADEEIRRPRREALATLTSLDSVKGQEEIKRGVEILLAFGILQTYDESEDALEHLEEVNTAAQRLFNIPSTKASSSSDDDVQPIDAILDVLIAFLDKSSADLRNLANLIVGMVAPAFTPSTIEHLVAQLEQSAAETIEVDEDEENGEAEVVDDDEDEELASGSDDEDEDEADSDSDDEDDSAESDDEANVKVDPAFRKRVADALKAAGVGIDEDAESGSDDDESEDEVWDDEQMAKVDEQLAEVFKQRANAGKSSDFKHLHIESVHFKNRILDFFDVFARKQSSNPVILHTIIPLLRLIQSTSATEPDLANKASSIIKSRLGKARDVPSTADAELTKETLQEIHTFARRSTSADLSTVCGIASLFVVRTVEAGSSSSDIIVETYRATLDDYMNRKSTHVHPPLITDFIRRFPVRAFPIATDLIRHADPVNGAKKVYRQAQAFTMLQIFSQQLATIAKTNRAGVEELVKGVADVIYRTIEDVATGKGEGWNAARLKDVGRLAIHLARSSKNTLGPTAEGLWEIKRLESVINKVKEGERTGEMKGLIDLLGQVRNTWRAKEPKKKQSKGEKGEKGKLNGVKPKDDSALAMDIDEPVAKSDGAVKKPKAKRDVNGHGKVSEGGKEKVKKRKESDSGEVKRKKVKATAA